MSSTSQASKPWHDGDRLERLYWLDGLSINELAEKFECGPTTILYWMDQHGIPRRDHANATRRATRVERAWFGVDNRGYELWTDSISGEQVKVAQLLACVDHDPHEVFREGTVVHHSTGHRRDNRPGQLEVMENDDHVRYHSRKDVPECKQRLLQSATIMEEERA